MKYFRLRVSFLIIIFSTFAAVVFFAFLFFGYFFLAFVDGTLWFYFYCSADWLIDKTKLKRLNLELRVANREREMQINRMSQRYVLEREINNNKRIELQNKTKI